MVIEIKLTILSRASKNVQKDSVASDMTVCTLILIGVEHSVLPETPSSEPVHIRPPKEQQRPGCSFANRSVIADPARSLNSSARGKRWVEEESVAADHARYLAHSAIVLGHYFKLKLMR